MVFRIAHWTADHLICIGKGHCGGHYKIIVFLARPLAITVACPTLEYINGYQLSVR